MGRRLQRSLLSEQLESRRPLAADLAALDINDDMSVTALDALLIINTINQRSASANSVVSAEAEAALNCDTNSDGVVTPIDVLNVVNQINSGIIAVPTDSTETTTTDPSTDTNGTVPNDADDTPLVDTNPGDDVTSSPNDDTGTDDTGTDDTGTDDTDSDPSDDPVDETDTDDNVVTDPNDDSDDDSSDDSTDDDTSDDTTDDDDTSEDDTSEDDPECEHQHPVRENIRALVGHRHHGRFDLFAALDDNGDGALSSDEVSEAIWNTLVDADADGSDSVTKAELKAYREAQRLAAVEAFFEQLDTDGSGVVTSADVSRLAWRFLSRADANNDGGITVDELLAVPLPGRLAGR